MSKENNLKEFLTDIANTIREKKGTTGLINPQDFSTEIASIPVNEKFNAFFNKTITEVTAEDLQGATNIGYGAFANCKVLTSVVIPNSVTSIGDYAFENCNKLASITIPNSVTSIGKYCFWRCENLTSVVIPESITSIPTALFRYCSKLTNVTIGSGVTDIGEYALQVGSSTNKATIRMLSTTPPTIQSNTFDATRLEKIIVPVGSLETYKTATNWSNFADYIVEEVAA